MSLLTVGGMFTWWGTSCTADSNMDFTDLNSCVKVSTSEWFSVCSSFCNNSRALMPSNTSRTLWVEWKELLNHDRTNKAQCIFFKQVAQTKQEYLVQSDKIHAEPWSANNKKRTKNVVKVKVIGYSASYRKWDIAFGQSRMALRSTPARRCSRVLITERYRKKDFSKWWRSSIVRTSLFRLVKSWMVLTNTFIKKRNK